MNNRLDKVDRLIDSCIMRVTRCLPGSIEVGTWHRCPLTHGAIFELHNGRRPLATFISPSLVESDDSANDLNVRMPHPN